MTPAPTVRSVWPILFGAGLFGLGTIVLFQILRGVDPDEIAAQIRATTLPQLGLAFLATVAGYTALVGFDWFALRYIGRHLGPGVVALGGFLGSAFGNTIGVSVMSGGAVRYRIYSAVGLNAFEVAAISGYISVALAMGLGLVGLGALALQPYAMGGLVPWPAETTRILAGLAAAGLGAVILAASLRRQRLRLWRMDLRLPEPADLGGQAAVTLIEIIAAAFALWILLPGSKPDFTALVAIYAAAAMLGKLSQVPGGMGVFETVVIGALWGTVPLAEAVAAVLMFRVVYYIVPFATGFGVLALNEMRMASGVGARFSARMSIQMRPALAAVHGIPHGLVAVVVFGLGTYLLLVTMIPSVRSGAMAGGELVAALLLEGGTVGSGIAGMVLLILSHGLVRRVASAWWLAVLVLAAAAIAALLMGLRVESAVLLLAGAVSLLPFRKAFDRPGRLTEGVFGPRWFATVIGVGAAAAALFFFVHKDVPYSNDLWTTFAPETGTSRSLRAGFVVTALMFLFGLYLLTRPMRGRLAVGADADTMAQAALIVRGSDMPQAWLSQTGDKRFLFSESGASFLMYGVRGGSWIALGDPVGSPIEFRDLCWRFCDLATRANFRPVFYEVSARHLQLWIDLGFTVNKIGEEAIVPLADFSLAGARFKTMRAALNKRQRDGYEFEILPPPHDAARMTILGQVSRAWLAGKTGQEKQFSVGRFDPSYLDLFDIAVVRKECQIVAFANILPACNGKVIAVDLMRYLPDEASGLMEYMFLRLIEHFKAQGAETLSLGAAPLAGLSEQSMARSWNRFGRKLYRHGGAFYNFEGLRAFKQKFQPDWQPRYLALPPNASPLIALGDTALLIAGSTRGLMAK